MNLDNLLSVSGKPGLYRMVTNKPSGLVIEGLTTKKREFASTRQHNFTPLASIAIFTDDGDSVPLRDVLEKMVEQYEDNKPPEGKASAEEYREYLRDVLPNHDEERVYTSDIKKLVKWFGLLKESGKLDEEPEAEETASEEASDTEQTAKAGENPEAGEGA